jgi:DNA-binding transcriptional MerR regulator
MPERTFTSQQALDLTDVTYRQLDYWTRAGRIRMTHQESVSPGSGFRREYSHADLVSLCVVKLCSDAGISVERASKLARGARTGLPTSVVVGELEIKVDTDDLIARLDARIDTFDRLAEQTRRLHA